MPKRSRKNSLDLNQLATSIVGNATAEKLLQDAVEDGKNPAAVLLGRLGGLKGGKARALNLPAEKRSEIAKNAAYARWQKTKKDK
ncbi:MAG: hypothetical protein PHQ35_02905 [Phycisphaerae bacterium]|nr:hypothetical protein [Phycisphaerae bacterium]MDD5380758.1 hypothetical protein [Phycisphaerae bacterium]